MLVIYTIGHATHLLEECAAMLQANGVARLP